MENDNNTSGWGFFDALRKNCEGDDGATDKVDQLYEDYKLIFSSAAGVRVLADLKKRYVDPDCLQGFYPDGANTAMAMAGRAAEQRLVNMLLTLDKKGNDNA